MSVPAVTKADLEALAELPDSEWFDAEIQSTRRPAYRCERLCRAGLLERRGTGQFPNFKSEYRKADPGSTRG